MYNSPVNSVYMYIQDMYKKLQLSPAPWACRLTSHAMVAMETYYLSTLHLCQGKLGHIQVIFIHLAQTSCTCTCVYVNYYWELKKFLYPKLITKGNSSGNHGQLSLTCTSIAVSFSLHSVPLHSLPWLSLLSLTTEQGSTVNNQL